MLNGFERYRAMAGDAKARDLLPRMLARQASVPEAKGGLPAEDLAVRFREIAEAYSHGQCLVDAFPEYGEDFRSLFEEIRRRTTA